MCSFVSNHSPHRIAMAGLTALLLGGTALPVLAQAAGQTEPDKATRLPSLKVEDKAVTAPTLQPAPDQGYKADRIISATRTDAALRDVPQSVSVVTRQQMDDQSITSMADVVRYVPGVVFAQGEGNRDTPIFRGNASTADFFVDGMRDDVQYYRDVYNIERVEVLKGPNALTFGRGGIGGVINRVTRQADWRQIGEVKLEVGGDDHYRGTFDLGQAISDKTALRLTGLYQNSGSYRDGVDYERWGLNPTASFLAGEATQIQLGYEHFEDERVADRGIPSYQGRALQTSRSTFFGDPDLSPTDSRVDAVNLAIEHDFGDGLSLRNRTRYADYSKFYQNVFPGAVNAARTTVAISAYNNDTARQTLINQTDLNYRFATGAIAHTLLAGMELARQETDNFRETGYFTAVGANTTSINVPVGSPRISVPITFRQSASDADNHGVAKSIAGYVQDQIDLTPQVQAILGLRFDRFDAELRNNRTNVTLDSRDNLWSPRAGLVYKPMETVSLYASYSLSYLPRAGEQLASLSASNRNLDPEKFTNYEVGVKWEVLPELMLSAALYQLDRTNVVVPDPANPTQSILVDGQRTKGVELGATGQVTKEWSVIASYAYQDGKLTANQSATVRAGAELANLPKHSAALWNRYDFLPNFGAGLGVTYQGTRYASTDNLVEMEPYARVDAALFLEINTALSAQLNVENVLDRHYYLNAHSNNNLTPAAPRTFRVGLTAKL